MLKKMKKAFTITELVIVIAVIAILAAVLIPTFSNVVENARKSSALQTCRNALTEYMTIVSTDEDTSNDDATGMVFEKDGYIHVYLNGSLHLLGTKDNLTRIEQSATAVKVGKFTENTDLDLPDPFSASATLNFNWTEKTGVNPVVQAKLNVAAPASPLGKNATYPTVAAGGTRSFVNGEVLYFYSIVLNGTTYYGWFILDTTANNHWHTVEGANYASACFVFANNVPGAKLAITIEAPAGA